MPEFSMKPVLVEAHQLPDYKSPISSELEAFITEADGGIVPITNCQFVVNNTVPFASYPDWVVKGPNGEFSVCSDDVFHRYYVTRGVEPENQEVFLWSNNIYDRTMLTNELCTRFCGQPRDNADFIQIIGSIISMAALGRPIPLSKVTGK